MKLAIIINFLKNLGNKSIKLCKYGHQKMKNLKLPKFKVPDFSRLVGLKNYSVAQILKLKKLKLFNNQYKTLISRCNTSMENYYFEKFLIDGKKILYFSSRLEKFNKMIPTKNKVEKSSVIKDYLLKKVEYIDFLSDQKMNLLLNLQNLKNICKYLFDFYQKSNYVDIPIDKNKRIGQSLFESLEEVTILFEKRKGKMTEKQEKFILFDCRFLIQKWIEQVENKFGKKCLTLNKVIE